MGGGRRVRVEWEGERSKDRIGEGRGMGGGRRGRLE